MRILVADDHELVHETIAAFLKSSGIEEVRTASSLGDAISDIKRSGSYDLVLLDYNMPDMDGLNGFLRMKKANEDRPVAILSGDVPRAIVDKAIAAGAAGFIPKTLASRSMASAAKFMAAGEIYAPVDFMQKPAEDPDSILSPRERDVLRGICKGQSNKDIARDLGIQEVTVKLHVTSMRRKIGAMNRTHAAIIARDKKLV
ncbi:MAG: response regulator transcription factor [Rhodobacteraceae bacterium]|nr:response regulator transcription factor [Paracoccaceae bacterium]